MSVPSNDINNIMDFLMKKDDDNNQTFHQKMESMDVGFGGNVSDSFLAETWPMSEDFMDNIFSMEGGLLDLGGVDNTPVEGLGMEPLNGTAASLAGSDSGLSMDHADLDLMDGDQLSPLLMHRSDEDILSARHHSDVNVSPLPSIESRSPPSSVSPTHSSTLSSDIDVGSPIHYYENNFDINSCLNIQNEQPTPAPPVQIFQNAPNLKRKSSAPTAVVLPKIQKHYITKPPSANSHTISATRPDGTKQRIIFSNVNGGALPSNIQIVNDKSFSVRMPDRNGQQKKLIRVAPVAGNPRSILLPVTIKDMKDFRSIKIINATDLKNPAKIQIAAANLLQKSKQASEKTRNNNILLATTAFETDSHHYIMEDSTSERGSGRSDDEDDDQMGYDDDFDPAPQANHKGQFPRLELTAEERRLLVKEGISLPSSYPLTRLEERELKRIRRKIRNKISAQDSRRRKKEYVDGLEDRVKQSTEENQTLMKRIKALQSQNHSLATQLRKLQSLVSNGSYKSAQPATCLMVLLLSVALVIAPSLRAGTAPPNSKDLQQSNLLTSIRRALLSAQPVIPQVDANGVLLSEELIDDEFNSEELVSSVHMSEHDYPLVSGDTRLVRGRFTSTGYMDIPLDEGGWPPLAKNSPSLHYPVKLENLEYDPDYDGSDFFLSHHEEVVDEDFDSKDIKYEDSIRIYDAAMEKLEILPVKDSIMHVAAKMANVMEVMPQVMIPEPRRIQNGVKRNHTQIRSVVLTQSPIELE